MVACSAFVPCGHLDHTGSVGTLLEGCGLPFLRLRLQHRLDGSLDRHRLTEGEVLADLVLGEFAVHDLGEIKEMNAKLDAFEQYIHDCGLYSVEDMRPINETRMAARWKLGKALAAVERNQGKRTDLTSRPEAAKLKGLLKTIGLDEKTARKAQRIGAMPDEEMARAFEQARSPPAARHYLDGVFDSVGAASAWARLPDVRRRYLVAEGGGAAGAVDCSTWRCWCR
jgi:hypothetical protein